MKKKMQLSALAVIALGISGLGNAQETAQTIVEVGDLEEVVVTGSRIARKDLTSVAPVQIVDSEAIELSAQVNIGDLINQLPSAGTPALNRTNSNFTNNGSGIVNIDLRDLGVSRTLTLVNGRRFVAGLPGTSAVDLNAIPTELIERVEVITGGASAVYGSDAVAGVVNFVLKDDFEGVELTTRYGESAEGDGEETVIDLLVGANFNDGRGNAVLNLTYTDQGAVFSRDRERTAIDDVSSVFFGGGIFEQTRPFFSSFPPQGRFDVSGTGGSGDDFTFLPDGTLVNSFSTNGDAASGRGADGFNRSAFRTIAVPTERYVVSSNLNYDISESTEFFFEGTYVNSQSQSRLEPFPLASDDIFTVGSGGIPLNYMGSNGLMVRNPYMPIEIYNAATRNGVDSVFFTRRLAEFGPRGAKNERQTFRGVIGLQGDLPMKDMSWDLSFNYGQSTQNQSSEGQVDITAFRNALLSERDPVTGQIQCVDPFARADGCIPINIFGFNSVSPEALAYVSAEQSRAARIEQKILQANLTGDLFTLPAGEAKFALGFEYRDESSDARNDALTVRGLNSSNAIPSVIGSFDVKEFYAELDIPVVSDSFVDYIGVGLAGRVSDYSTVGSTGTFEGRLEVRPVENLMLRGSVARAVRAPNIDELFDPGGQTFAQVSDPCEGVTATTPGVVAENCRSNPDIVARIARDGAFVLTQSELQGTTGFIGGNPNLEEEEADTFTIGFVYSPNFLPSGHNASLTVDYFDIEVESAILAVSQNNVLDLCFGSVGLSSPLCENIVRFPSGSPFAGALDEVNSGAANVGAILTSGIDLSLNYDMDLSDYGLSGALGVITQYTYLDNYDIINLPGEEPDNEDGEIGNAKHKWQTSFRYSNDRLRASLNLRYIGESRIEDTDFSDEDCVELECETDGVLYTDVRASYSLQNIYSEGSLEIFGGVRNLFDEEGPLLAAGLTDADTGVGTAGGVYDAIGRTYYIGGKLSF